MAVTWLPNTETNLAGYYVYYGPRSRTYTNRIRVDKTLTLARVEPLMAGGTYYMTITAVNDRELESLPAPELVYRVPIPPNTPPPITAIDDIVMAEDSPSELITFYVSDLESPPGALTLKAHSSNPSLIPDDYIIFGGTDAERNLIIIPQLEQSGSADITVEVRDPFGASSSVTFTVYVVPLNDDPVISTIPDQVVNEDVCPRIPFYIFDAESGPDELWLIAVSSNQQLIPDDRLILGGSGNSRAITLLPLTNTFGTTTIQLYVIDADIGYSYTEFTVTVRAVNDAPTISQIPNLTLDEDAVSGIIQLTVADIDSSVTDVKLSGSSTRPGLIAPDSFVFGGTDARRTMVIKPKPNEFGTCMVRVIATDSGGASSTNYFSLTVNAVNDLPTIDDIPSFAMVEGSGPLAVPLTGINTGATNELQTLTVTVFSSRPDIIPTPQVDYTSPSSFGLLLISAVRGTTGASDVTVVLDDGEATVVRIFTVTVQSVNDPPTIFGLPDLAVLRVPSQPLRLNFTVQDPDTPAEQLTLTAYSSDPGVLPVGNLVFSGAGTQRTLTITPMTGRTGLATVTVVVSDGDTAISTSFYVLVTLASP